MDRSRSLLVCFLVVLFFSSWVAAQTSRVNGTLRLQVVDSGGAGVASADVAVSNDATGLQRKSVTDSQGLALVSGLPDGEYRIAVTASGFQPYAQPGVHVSVGSETSLTATLQVRGVQQQVRVSAQAAALDTTATSSPTTIDRERIEELPVESRNYLAFTLLAPTVAPANPAAGLYQASTENSGFSFGGLRPYSNAVYIDGVDDNDEFTGESRTELSPEAVSEFQIVNHGYAAESGGSAGGSIDVETRSGANAIHGDAFIFEQNGAINATPPLEVVPRKPDSNAVRTGLSIGGPLRKNKTFGYTAAEQEMGRGEDANDLSPAAIAQINSALQSGGPLQGTRLHSGFFPTINQQTEFTARLDQAVSQQNSLMLRYAMTNTRSINDAFGLAEWNDSSARGTSLLADNALIGGWTDVLNPRTVNELHLQAATRRADLRTGSRSGPGVSIPGLVEFGTPYTGNGVRHETHFELNEALTQQRGKHLLKGGIGAEDVLLRAAIQDGFSGFYVFPSVAQLAAQAPVFYTQAFGRPDTNFSVWRLSAFLEDHWTLARPLTMDYGLRYDRNQLPSGFHTDVADFSPRLGLAWTPKKNWVVRSGFGTFFDRFTLSSINRAIEYSGAHALDQIAEGPRAAAIYRSGVDPGRPNAGIAPSVVRPQPGLRNPYSEVASLDVEHAFSPLWTATLSYHFVRGVRMERTVNTNLAPPFLLNSANSSQIGILDPLPQQLGSQVFGPARINPAYDAVDQLQTEANSRYDGVTAQVNRRLFDEFEVLAGYTYARTIDDASYPTEQPANPYNLRAERGPSLLDQRHRFAMSGLWDLPFGYDPDDGDNNPANNPLEKALENVEVAWILQSASGFANDPLTGFDTAQEHIYPFAARPLGYGRNSLRTPWNTSLDLRVLKTLLLGPGHLDIVAESFNLLNRRNIDLLNPVYGTARAPSSSFAAPLQAADPRLVQFSLDYEF